MRTADAALMYKTDLKILTMTWVFLIATVCKNMLFAVIQHIEITESVCARSKENVIKF